MTDPIGGGGASRGPSPVPSPVSGPPRLPKAQLRHMLLAIYGSDPTNFAALQQVIALEAPKLDAAGLCAQMGITNDQFNSFVLKVSKTWMEQHMKEEIATNKQEIDKINTATDNAVEAAKTAASDKIAAWFEAIFEVIGAALAIAVTATAAGVTGGALVIGVVGAVIGMVMALDNLANLALQSANGGTGVDTTNASDGSTEKLDISIQGLVKMTAEATVPGWKDMSKDDQDKIVNAWTQGVTALLTLFTLASAGAPATKGLMPAFKTLLKEGLKSAKTVLAAERSAAVLEKAGIGGEKMQGLLKGTTVLNGFGQGATVTTRGVLGFKMADETYNEDVALADKKELQTFERELMSFVKQDNQSVTSHSKAIFDNWAMISDMLAAWGQTQQLINSNSPA